MPNAIQLIIVLWIFFLPVLYLFVNSVQIPDDLDMYLLFAFSFEMIKTS